MLSTPVLICRRTSLTIASGPSTQTPSPPDLLQWLGKPLDDPQHSRREHIGTLRQDGRQLSAQEMQSLPHRYSALQQERADLIDDACALTDQSLAHSMECLQVELVGGLGRNEFHG